MKKGKVVKKMQMGGRRKNIKAAGGRCKTTKTYKNSQNNTCGNSNKPIEKFKKAVNVITTVTALGGAALGGFKLANKLKK